MSYVQNAEELKAVTHIIFDMDGLLLDTESLYTKATNIIASKYSNKSVRMDWSMKVAQMGLPKSVLAPLICKQLDLSITPEEYLEKSKQLHLQLFPDVRRELLKVQVFFSAPIKLNAG